MHTKAAVLHASRHLTHMSVESQALKKIGEIHASAEYQSSEEIVERIKREMQDRTARLESMISESRDIVVGAVGAYQAVIVDEIQQGASAAIGVVEAYGDVLAGQIHCVAEELSRDHAGALWSLEQRAILRELGDHAALMARRATELPLEARPLLARELASSLSFLVPLLQENAASSDVRTDLAIMPMAATALDATHPRDPRSHTAGQSDAASVATSNERRLSSSTRDDALVYAIIAVKPPEHGNPVPPRPMKAQHRPPCRAPPDVC